MEFQKKYPKTKTFRLETENVWRPEEFHINKYKKVEKDTLDITKLNSNCKRITFTWYQKFYRITSIYQDKSFNSERIGWTRFIFIDISLPVRFVSLFNIFISYKNYILFNKLLWGSSIICDMSTKSVELVPQHLLMTNEAMRHIGSS